MRTRSDGRLCSKKKKDIFDTIVVFLLDTFVLDTILRFDSSIMTTGVVICSIARTPIAKFCGTLSSLKGSELGSVAIRAAVSQLKDAIPIKEAYLGNVVSAGMGQAPGKVIFMLVHA